MRSRIMIVGRGVALRARLARVLNGGGYQAEIAENAQHARRFSAEGVALAIVASDRLDQGEERLLPELRAAVGSVLVATSDAKRELGSDVIDISDEAGLLARVAEALKPADEDDEDEPLLEFGGGYRLDLAGHSLAGPTGKDIPLTAGEFDLLLAFVRRPGRVLTRDNLLRALTGRDAEAYDRSVDMQIVRLRRKLEPDPKRPTLIVTVAGSGYKFVATVREVERAPPPEASPRTTQPIVETEGRGPERRYVAALAAELVAAEGDRLPSDPEDLSAIVAAFRSRAAVALTPYGGVIGERRGREIVAYFGLSHAQENDGERAVRAALAMQRTLVDLNAPAGAPQLAVRIGLDSGLVVVDALGEVHGEAPNVAARARSAAAPGEIWITGGVHRQIAGLFVAEDKGAPENAQLFRVVRVSGGGRRGGSRASTPLVGRAEELDRLTRRWERARRGEGQLSLIVGEPGLGKSRLIDEFRARLSDTPHTWIEWASSQLLHNTPLHPIAEWGRARFGGAEAPGQKRLAELEAALRSVGLDAAEHAALLAPIVDAPLPPERIPKLSPEALRSQQLAAITAWVLAGARAQPLVLAFEDLHWADPTSLDVLQALAERGAQAPLLILATTRPEFQPPWKIRSHHGVISLAPLDAGEVARMVGEIATRDALSKDVIAGVFERSGGVPLFVEEVTRLLLERGEAGGAQAIPPTLQQSLAARLDRLGPAREVAQIAAVLGRGFSYALLKSVAGDGDPGSGSLDAALEKLADAELLFVEGVAPNATYRFKHALIQDAAYDGLLKGRRQTLHRRAAEVLLASPTPEAEALAHHFTQAGQTDLAIEWWGKAGDQALRRSAFAEAISHLGKAIELSDKAVGAAKPRDAAATASANPRLKLQADYGRAVMWSKGFSAEETKASFSRVGDLAAQTGDAQAPLDAYFGRYAHSLWRGDLGSAREAIENLRREAERGARLTELASAHRGLGYIFLIQGEFAQARAHLEQTLRIYDPERDREVKFRFAADAAVAATTYFALGAWWTGDVARARALMDDAHAQAAESAHPPTLANTFLIRAWLEVLRDDAVAVRRAGETVVELCRKHDLALYMALGELFSSWARAKLGDFEGASTELRQSVQAYASQGNKLQLPFYRGMLAEVDAERGNSSTALAEIESALAMADETGEHWFDAGLHRIRGEILLKQNSDDAATAEAAFLEAIAVAQRQKARGFELRAALSLAKLYQSIGRPTEAHHVLGPALQGFAPTPEFPTIAEAKTLFESLAADEPVKAEAARRARRLKLQTDYGHAVMWSRGFVAEETKAALARMGELTTEVGAADAPLDAFYARWAQSFFRGELRLARQAAKSFLSEAERKGRPTEAGVAHRVLGYNLLDLGDFARARTHFEQTLSIYDPERDREAKFHLGPDSKVAASAYLAVAAWCLGDVGRARDLIDEARGRAVESAHAPTLATEYYCQAWLEILREDAEAALGAAEALVALSNEHGIATWLDVGRLPAAWARAKLGERGATSAALRQSIEEYSLQGNKLALPFYQGLLAELEAETRGAEAALAALDEALAMADETGEHWFDAGLHRIRGEILLKQNPADFAPAEAAFLAAIAVARRQGVRSFELRAALPLAKLYLSIGRPTEAHVVLGPALEGFSPTPEFPDIAEAKALYEALAAEEPVKADAARRAQRLKLQTSYGQAVLWAKGYTADETKVALARVEALASETGNSEAPLDAYYGRWGRYFFRAELAAARETAESFLCEARPTEAAVAHRLSGLTLLFQGDFAQARVHLEQALRNYDPERDREAKFRFGPDSKVAATTYLALEAWCVGDAGRAWKLMEEASAGSAESAHVPTIVNTYQIQTILETFRDDAGAARRAAENNVALCREHGLALSLAIATLSLAWAREKLGERATSSTEFRQALADYVSGGNKLLLPFYQGLLAKLEAEARGAEAGLAEVDRALALAAETGEHWFDAGLHRIRGEILLKHDPTPAEAALLAAIAVAQRQKARGFELRAALSLAKLYRSTGRRIEARAVLAAALEGFSPTPEFPQIAEAKALFEATRST